MVFHNRVFPEWDASEKKCSSHLRCGPWAWCDDTRKCNSCKVWWASPDPTASITGHMPASCEQRLPANLNTDAVWRACDAVQSRASSSSKSNSNSSNARALLLTYMLSSDRNSALGSTPRRDVANSAGAHLPSTHSAPLVYMRLERGFQMVTDGSSCKHEHMVTVDVLHCEAENALSVGSLRSIPSPLVTASLRLQSTMPSRPCQDVLKFRSRGPEDPRLIFLGRRRAMVIVADYAPAASEPPVVAAHEPAGPRAPYGIGSQLPHVRRMVAHIIRLPSASNRSVQLVGLPRMLRPASSAIANLSRLEKNWSPFFVRGGGGTRARYDGGAFVHQWLPDERGKCVVFRLAISHSAGELTERFESECGWLRAALGAPSHAVISGGTPAVAINSSHHLAIGHTMDSHCNRKSSDALAREACFRDNLERDYALFAYVFESAPPFQLTGATPLFSLQPAASEGTSANDPLGAASVLTLFRDHTQYRRSQMVRFPVGLFVDPSDLAWISWGLQDTVTMLSSLPVRCLIEIMQHRQRR